MKCYMILELFNACLKAKRNVISIQNDLTPVQAQLYRPFCLNLDTACVLHNKEYWSKLILDVATLLIQSGISLLLCKHCTIYLPESLVASIIQSPSKDGSQLVLAGLP